MKLEFELSEAQENVVKKVMAIVKPPIVTENDLAKEVFIQYLIQSAKGMVEEELRK